MTKATFFCDQPDKLERVYDKGRRERVEALCDVYPDVVSRENLGKHLTALRDIDVVFSTWGMFTPSPEQLDALPDLKAVFYAAGSVRGFAGPMLERGISVVSAWAANGVPVAEFTVAQILLANKGYFRNVRDCASPLTRPRSFAGPGNFGETVALLGAGMIGRLVIERLRQMDLHTLVFDPFLSGQEAEQLGVEKVSLSDAFRRGRVVSNHLANVPETRRLITGAHFNSMRPDAVFINTGRGATVAEDEMLDVLRERSDLTALLDVTYPEPPQPDSPLYDLPNVLVSSHIAGSVGDEVVRMADTVIEEFTAWQQGRPLRYSVNLKMLERMA